MLVVYSFIHSVSQSESLRAIHSGERSEKMRWRPFVTCRSSDRQTWRSFVFVCRSCRLSRRRRPVELFVCPLANSNSFMTGGSATRRRKINATDRDGAACYNEMNGRPRKMRDALSSGQQQQVKYGQPVAAAAGGRSVADSQQQCRANI